jgi:hypothetical protein
MDSRKEDLYIQESPSVFASADEVLLTFTTGSLFVPGAASRQ